MSDFSDCLRDIKDFPKPGILFKDISPLFTKPEKFSELIDLMSKTEEAQKAEAFVGIDARGFIFASALSQKMNKPMIMARKAGKLPGDVVAQVYSLEYGEATVEMHSDALDEVKKVLVIDDVLATGGTAKAVGDLVKKLGGEITGYLFFAELKFLDGRQLLATDNVKSFIEF